MALGAYHAWIGYLSRREAPVRAWEILGELQQLQWDDQACFDSRVLVQEAVSNAVKYGRSDWIHLMLYWNGQWRLMMMTLRYASDRFDTNPPEPSHDAETGRGIQLMRGICEEQQGVLRYDWGMVPGFLTVWLKAGWPLGGSAGGRR